MDDSPEVIRQQMEETRASLSEKLETLEQQVVGTVQDARAAVTDTVETVKEAVHETVESVKDTFDISRQMERHPWAMLGGSIALGYVGGLLFEQLEAPQPYATNGHGVPAPVYDRPPNRTTNGATGETNGGPDSDHGHSLLRQFEPEIARLKGLAVGAAMSVVRDMISGSIPDPLKPQVRDVMNSLTVKLGGEPIRAPLLEPAPARQAG